MSENAFWFIIGRVALMTNPNSVQFPLFCCLSHCDAYQHRLPGWQFSVSLSLFLNLFPSYRTEAAHQLFQYTFVSSCYKFHLPEMTSERCCGPIENPISFIKKWMWNYYYYYAHCCCCCCLLFRKSCESFLFFVVYNNNLRHCSYKQTSSSFFLYCLRRCF